MIKLISFLISPLVLGLVLTELAIFHPIQMICYNFFGYNAHKKSVDILNAIILRTGNLLLGTFTFINKHEIPKGVPLIFVENHQSLYDIVMNVVYLRKYHPKFVSKKELGKGIPSVSYNLRKGGSVLIDRKDPRQALPAIKELAEYIEKTKRSAVIFPEGTRGRKGKTRVFSQNGLRILCKHAPSAYIVPVSINNSWKLLKYGMFPYGLGSKITFTVHEPMAVKDYSFDELFEKTERVIKDNII